MVDSSETRDTGPLPRFEAQSPSHCRHVKAIKGRDTKSEAGTMWLLGEGRTWAVQLSRQRREE
jgi:hypothetical protein